MLEERENLWYMMLCDRYKEEEGVPECDPNFLSSPNGTQTRFKSVK